MISVSTGEAARDAVACEQPDEQTGEPVRRHDPDGALSRARRRRHSGWIRDAPERRVD
jgi:hypothetical protein